METTTINVMIINNRNKYFKYTITSEDFANEGGLAAGDYTKACLKAIDKYLETELKFEQLCSVTKAFWTNVTANTQSNIDIRVSYANGFCKKDLYKIKNVLVIDEKYPIEA